MLEAIKQLRDKWQQSHDSEAARHSHMNQCGAMARFIDDLDEIIEQEEDRKE